MPATSSPAGERGQHGRPEQKHHRNREQRTAEPTHLEGTRLERRFSAARTRLPSFADTVGPPTTTSAVQPAHVAVTDAMITDGQDPTPASTSGSEIWRLAEVMINRANISRDDPRQHISVMNLKNAIDRQDEELKRLRADLVHYMSAYEELEKSSEQIPDVESQLQKRVKDLEAENRNLRWILETIAPASTVIEQLSSQVQQQATQIERQNTQIEQQNTQIEQKTTQDEQWTTSTAKQAALLEQKTTQNEQLAARNEKLTTRTTQQGKQIEQQAAQIRQQTTQVEQQKQYIKDLQNQLEKLKKQVLEQRRTERQADKDRIKQELNPTETRPNDGQPTSQKIFDKAVPTRPIGYGAERHPVLPNHQPGVAPRLPERPYDRHRSRSPIRNSPDLPIRESRNCTPLAIRRPVAESARHPRSDAPVDSVNAKPRITLPSHASYPSSLAGNIKLGGHKVERSELAQKPLSRTGNTDDRMGNATLADARTHDLFPPSNDGYKEGQRHRKLACHKCHNLGRAWACDGSFPCTSCEHFGDRCYYVRCRSWERGLPCANNRCTMLHDELGYS
ncbi:uncharacterized protein BKCO1_32000101 [Diplodia corticola]|uniref:Uncharacterized protein n=1 Tax=Diplodia corticola TaxID=236234 RepID=A0A1J9QXT2_9PEZI|nr:uncharacterized protein BKCO1_32000101 [Diplodia corticola]OJD33177.1 hypothetical protein BKCO1_32000101 [Diplodia corticola]